MVLHTVIDNEAAEIIAELQLFLRVLLAYSSQINVPRSSKSMASSQCFAPWMTAHPDVVTGC